MNVLASHKKDSNPKNRKESRQLVKFRGWRKLPNIRTRELEMRSNELNNGTRGKKNVSNGGWTTTTRGGPEVVVNKTGTWGVLEKSHTHSTAGEKRTLSWGHLGRGAKEKLGREGLKSTQNKPHVGGVEGKGESQKRTMNCTGVHNTPLCQSKGTNPQ